MGSSIDLSSAAGGGSVDEEIEAFQGIVDVVMAEVQKAGNAQDTR